MRVNRVPIQRNAFMQSTINGNDLAGGLPSPHHRQLRRWLTSRKRMLRLDR